MRLTRRPSKPSWRPLDPKPPVSVGLAAGLGEAIAARDRVATTLQTTETELGAAKVELGSVTTSIAGANDRVRRLLESLEDFRGRSS